MSHKINLNELVNTRVSDWPEYFDKVNVIYKITNLINGDSYVGQTRSFKIRFYRGYVPSINKWVLSGYQGDLGHLFNAIRLFGVDKFEVSILEFNIELKELSNREIYWISHYNTFKDKGYNRTEGGGDYNWSESARDSSRRSKLKLWPDTNGTPPQWGIAGREASRITRYKTYPETNGVSPNWFNAGIRKSRFNRSIRSYEALLDMCIEFKCNGGKVFKDRNEYLIYKRDFTPMYEKNTIKRSFNNYLEFGFDLSLISECIRKDWQ